MQPNTTAVAAQGNAPEKIFQFITNGTHKFVHLSEPEAYNPVTNALLGALNEIIPNLGEEFRRHTYDMSVLLKVALDQAGYRIVRKPQSKVLSTTRVRP